MMIFYPLQIDGALLIAPRPMADERGFFARAWCRDEFQRRGLNTVIAQCNLAHNRARGTLRGLHLQRPPLDEARLVRCFRGSIFDVIVDARPDSPTFARWEAVQLSGDNRRMVYVPPGCGHGYQALDDETDVFYQVSQPHSPAHSLGFRWDDPRIGIRWPLSPTCLSPRDRHAPSFDQMMSTLAAEQLKGVARDRPTNAGSIANPLTLPSPPEGRGSCGGCFSGKSHGE